MRNVFIGHFRPTKEEFDTIWESCIFSVDANVLLNFYRYSEETRKELEKSLVEVKDRLYITHQAGKEFLRNRLSVTAEQANEYVKAVSAIEELKLKINRKERHPFLSEEKMKIFETNMDEIIEDLKNQERSILSKLTKDEILDFVADLFEGRTGGNISDNISKEVEENGAERYDNDVPPGFKDANKNDSGGQNRQYGDLFVWLELIEKAAGEKKPIIFITDDKKEDWWKIQNGKTIGPRPELIEEFYKKTGNRFWMYTTDKFIKESAVRSDTSINEDVLNEIINLRISLKQEEPRITVKQTVYDYVGDSEVGYLVVRLNKPMKYATGTGHFESVFSGIPNLSIKFVEGPGMEIDSIKFSYGCGHPKNFHVHLKGIGGELPEGEYGFLYSASPASGDFMKRSDE